MSDEQSKKKPSLAIWALGILAAAAFVILFWRGPWWFDSAHIRDTNLQPADGVVITGFRTGLVALAAGIIAGIGLWYTHQSHRHAERLYEHGQDQFNHARDKDREQAALTREGQVTGRYVEAIKLLASDKVHERLGGIYALERIMTDSDRDHRTIVEVLSAFLRTKLQEETGKDAADGEAAAVAGPSISRESAKTHLRTLEEDVKAALTVLSRRASTQRQAVPTELVGIHLVNCDLVGLSWEGVNLVRANLQGANLKQGNLSNVTLDDANLDRATLTRASLRDASLNGAVITAADLVRADLSGANLRGARLSHAILNNIKAPQARLTGARLEHVSLNGADLSDAELDRSRLDGARLREANLQRTNLQRADLQRANLEKVDFTGARLHQADLEGANLRGARLGEAEGLTEYMLLKARIDRSTVLPPGLAESAPLQDHIADLEARDAEEEEAAIDFALAMERERMGEASDEH